MHARGKPSGRSVTDITKLCPQSTILDGLAVRGGGVKNARNEVSEWLREIGMIEELKPQTNFKSSTSAEDLLQQTSSTDLLFGFRVLGGWLGF